MSVTLLRGNALALPLADESVDLVVTSPPYFGLRSYTDGGAHYSGQIGSEATPGEFLDALIAATRELVRVLKPTGSLWINLGDKYNANQGEQGATGDRATRSQAATYGRTRSVPGLRLKSLMGIPWRYALRCIGHGTALADPDVVRLLLRDVATGVIPLWAAEQLVDELAATPDEGLGLILRAEVIWSKPNGLPESVTDRVRRSHEQWFHFTKAPRYYAAVDEVREPHVTGDATTRVRTSDYARGMTGAMNGAGNPLGKLPGSVWTIPTQPLTVPAELGVDHFASYPMEWPRRLILGWSPPGICTECGEGRRPVAQRDDVDPAIVARRSQRHVDTVTGDEGRSRRQGESSRRRVNLTAGESPATRITGYACACTPYTDHPGTGESSGEKYEAAIADGRRPPVFDSSWGPTETRGLSNRPRVGPWREYHYDRWTPAPTRPAVVVDPFGGTGTTALVADALGRHGISVDMSADYCRLAGWRTTDPGQRAAAMQVEKPPPVPTGHDDGNDLLSLLDEEATA